MRRFPARLVPWGVCALALAMGLTAAVYYARQELTLSHYDARAHLVVARRITDSLTPGWRQIGAVWLPLPHVLNMPIVMSDWAYRTGYPGTAVSVIALAAGLAAFSGFVMRRTGSLSASIVAPTLVLINPNVLYLQSTPMTEPLLLGLSFLSVALVDRWLECDTSRARRAAGASIFALALTRYEGWLVAGALVGLAALARVGRPRASASLALAPYLATAIGSFLVLSWASTGVWFVSSGFFEHDPSTYQDAFASWLQVYRSTQALGGWALIVAAMTGAVAALVRFRRTRPELALVITLCAAAGLPLFAFYQGHPHRVRYMIPLVAASAALAAVAVSGLPRRLRGIAAVGLVAVVAIERPPFDSTAPMVTEAQWETPFRRGRRTVTTFLSGAHDGTPILASMGSLGHYMQEAAQAGFRLSDFVHEGNGDLWSAALVSPGRHVNWILVEERAEGGDVLAARARSDPNYLAAFARVAEGGGVALYRRTRTGPETPR